MPTPQQRGRAFEERIAKDLRRKGFPAYRTPRSGAGPTYKADIAAPGFNFHIEAKSQDTIKLLEWWRQTTSGCPIYKSPALLLETAEGDLTVMRTEDFLNLVKQIQDDTDTIKQLRNP